MNTKRNLNESQIARRNPFNLFITIASFPLELDYPLYYINLKVKLNKKTFACIFGQIWGCWIASPYMWIYDENVLLCHLRSFWDISRNHKNVYVDVVTKQFLQQTLLRLFPLPESNFTAYQRLYNLLP